MTTYPSVVCLLVLTAMGPLDTTVGNPSLLNPHPHNEFFIGILDNIGPTVTPHPIIVPPKRPIRSPSYSHNGIRPLHIQPQRSEYRSLKDATKRLLAETVSVLTYPRHECGALHLLTGDTAV
jgi:hypothetical protein